MANAGVHRGGGGNAVPPTGNTPADEEADPEHGIPDWTPGTPRWSQGRNRGEEVRNAMPYVREYQRNLERKAAVSEQEVRDLRRERDETEARARQMRAGLAQATAQLGALKVRADKASDNAVDALMGG